MGRMTFTLDDVKASKLIKPGWFPVLLKEFTSEINSKKDAMNEVLDAEIADRESEFFGTPIKHWFSEKGVRMPGGAVSFARAFNPKASDEEIAKEGIDYDSKRGLYIYAKIETNRGKDGQDPPRNVIADWAPLPPKFKALNEGAAVAVAGTPTFGS
jgi:hypothetical protein